MSSSLFPNLAPRPFDQLTRASHVAGGLRLDQLLARAEAHLAEARASRDRYPFLNLPLAEAITALIRRLVGTWEALPEHARPWLKAAIHYFAVTDDEENDFSSPVGFEDDVEMLNACLDLAGHPEWHLRPEDFDHA